MLCSNICGLRNNFEELKYVTRKRKPDLFFLDETHAIGELDINDLKIKKYDVLHSYSHSKHTGGVCVYIKKGIKYKNVFVVQQEFAWYLSIEININTVPTVFACVYLSARNEHKSAVLDSFTQWYESACLNKQIVVCGDFNIDMLSNTTYSRCLRNTCDDNGLTMGRMNKI